MSRICAARASRPPPFPYTTLFRSGPRGQHRRDAEERIQKAAAAEARAGVAVGAGFAARGRDGAPARRRGTVAATRSAEHTSELQSPYDLVRRLPREKKKRRPTRPA